MQIRYVAVLTTLCLICVGCDSSSGMEEESRAYRVSYDLEGDFSGCRIGYTAPDTLLRVESGLPWSHEVDVVVQEDEEFAAMVFAACQDHDIHNAKGSLAVDGGEFEVFAGSGRDVFISLNVILTVEGVKRPEPPELIFRNLPL